MEFTRLQRSDHFKASCLCTMYWRPGRNDTQLITCFSCQHMEFNWRWYFEDVYICSKCKDLDSLGSHRNAFLKLFHHLTNILPPPILLPFLFDYLYPVELRHRHTRTQQQRTLKFFLLGSPGTQNFFFNLHKQLQEQMRWGHKWKGKTYYQQSRYYQNDLLTLLCAYLI